MILEPWRRSVSPGPFDRRWLSFASSSGWWRSPRCAWPWMRTPELFFLGGWHFLYHVCVVCRFAGLEKRNFWILWRAGRWIQSIFFDIWLVQRTRMLIESAYWSLAFTQNHIWLLVRGPMTRFVWRSCFNCVAVCWALKIGGRFDRCNGDVVLVVLLKRPFA